MKAQFYPNQTYYIVNDRVYRHSKDAIKRVEEIGWTIKDIQYDNPYENGKKYLQQAREMARAKRSALEPVIEALEELYESKRKKTDDLWKLAHKAKESKDWLERVSETHYREEAIHMAGEMTGVGDALQYIRNLSYEYFEITRAK